MPILDRQGRLFGRINLLDLSFAIVVLALVSGIILVRSGRTPLRKVVRAQGPAEVTVLIRGSVSDLSIFKKEKAFITIRNQPYAPVDIVDVQAERMKVSLPTPNGKGVQAFPDPSLPWGSNVLITVRDPNALVTDDGIVLGGNKVKVGVQIELETFRYRLAGSIVKVSMPGLPRSLPDALSTVG